MKLRMFSKLVLINYQHDQQDLLIGNQVLQPILGNLHQAFPQKALKNNKGFFPPISRAISAQGAWKSSHKWMTPFLWATFTYGEKRDVQW